MRVSRRFSGIAESATLKMGRLAKELKAQGKPVVDFTLGEPDFDTPQHIKEAARRALDEGHTHYTQAAGIPELREEIASRLNEDYGLDVRADDVLVTPGAKHAIYEAFMAILDAGDAVILVEPAWVSYAAAARLAGGEVVWTKRFADRREEVTYERLEKVFTPKAKILVINSPNNPVGYVLSKKELEEIAEFAKDKNLLVLSDEIYSKIIYEREHICFATLDGMAERTILVDGFSKTYAMTGWRVGYAVAPPEILNAMLKVQQHSVTCATSFAQFGALAALRDERSKESLKEMVAEFKRRRDLIVEGLQKLGLRCERPDGAFYVFVNVETAGMDGETFAEKALREFYVATTPGSAFGPSCGGYVRFSYATSTESIREGLQRLGRMLEGNA